MHSISKINLFLAESLQVVSDLSNSHCSIPVLASTDLKKVLYQDRLEKHLNSLPRPSIKRHFSHCGLNIFPCLGVLPEQRRRLSPIKLVTSLAFHSFVLLTFTDIVGAAAASKREQLSQVDDKPIYSLLSWLQVRAQTQALSTIYLYQYLSILQYDGRV